MVKPIELIDRARARIARIAAIRRGLHPSLPALTALVLAAALAPLAGLARERFSYFLAPGIVAEFRTGLLALGLIALSIAAVMALRAYRKANSFKSAAEQIDSLTDAKQEIITLAELADPGAPGDVKQGRTSLFPTLWRRAAARLSDFQPERVFRWNVGRPLARSGLLSLALIACLALVLLALVEPPSPALSGARRLRLLASAIEKSAPGPESAALALKLRATAAMLENPNVSPPQKLERLNQVMRELKQQKPEQTEKGGKGNSEGEGANGQGTGAGQGTGKGAGAGKGEGPGTGMQGTGKEGSARKPDKGGEQQIAEIEKELTEARSRIESASEPGNSKIPSPSKEQAGAAKIINPNEAGKTELPTGAKKPGASPSQTPGNAANKMGGKGDTHLGEFPAPLPYERFYKPGEKGAKIEVHDARYVLFRLPSATLS